MTHQQALDGMASERYLLNEMSEVERFEFEAHYFDCVECAEDVRLAHVMREEAQRGAAKPNVAPTNVVSGFSRTSPKVLPLWRRPMVAVPWAAAAALALAVGYQSLVIAPERRNAAEVLAPVMLRGATRGAVPVVTIADGQRFVTLAVDLITPPQTRALRYELVRAGHAAVLSGDAPLPPQGAPLMLLFPAAELDRGARYSLIIRSADAPSVVIGEYEFDVS